MNCFIILKCILKQVSVEEENEMIIIIKIIITAYKIQFYL